MRHQSFATALFCACLMLAACGGDKASSPPQVVGEDSLPQPDAAGGSVTGMPNPGAPSVQPPRADELAIDTESTDVAREPGNVIDPNAPMNAPEPGKTGEITNLPPETMPTMPAPTPDPVESRPAVPPQS